MSWQLLKPTFVTGGMTFISRITGLVRDIVFAKLIGAGVGVAADAFYVAFRIPNFLRRIFGEGAFSQAFVPVLSQYKAAGDARSLQAFLDYITGVLGLILLVITVLVVLAAPWVILVLAPGFLDDPQKYDLTVQMLRIMFPYLMFISLVAMAGGILNTYGRFGVPAFTPVLLNLCLIGAALWLAPQMDQPVVALAWGVFLAGVVQLLFQLPPLYRLRLLPRPRLNLQEPGVRRVFRLMVPAVFSVSVAQINLLINTLLASFLITGSVSWLYYSDRLMEFPVGVFGVALATVILPSLSQTHAQASKEEFSHTIDWGLRLAVVITVPAAVGLIVMSAPLLISLFQYGAFGPHDVIMTQRALIAFALGLPAFVLIKILAPGFYARQDMTTPVRVGVITLIVNILMSLLLVMPLAHSGLALATSIAAVANAVLLYRGLRAQQVYRPRPGWSGLLAKIVLASTLMGVVLGYEGMNVLSWLQASAGERVTKLAFWIILGMLIYIASLWILRVNMRELWLKPASGQQEVE